MPPAYHQTEAGFLYGLDPDFKNAIGEVNKTTFNIPS
jgi:hypothetical protein